jgi:hypothetical protein
MNPQQIAAQLVDKFGLPNRLTEHLARLVPPDTDATAFLAAAIEQPKHNDLVPFLGDDKESRNQMILRLSVLAANVVDHLHRRSRLTKNQYEELIAEALVALGEVVPYLDENVKNIPGYVFVSVKRKVLKRLDWLRLFKSREPDEPYADDLPARLKGRKRKDDDASFFAAVCAIYTDFYACVRDPLDQAILEMRWQFPDGLRLGCAYASDIAQALGLTTDQVVERLELLQRRYLKLVNARRRSRGHRALRPRSINRVHRPDNCASALDLTTCAVREVA